MWKFMNLPVGRSGAESYLKTGEVRSARVYQSMLNRFFVGRSDIFKLPARQEGLVVFANPPESKTRTFMQVMSVTSNLGRRSIFWFDVVTSATLAPSKKLANAHRGAPELPNSTIGVAVGQTVPITGGIDVFERLLVGKQTLLLDQEGKFILEPGHNHSVFFPAAPNDDEIDIAVAWWEEPLA